MTEKIDVVVIGGGYAGVMAANRLTGNPDVAVTLINPRPDFVERIRLHQLVGGSADAVVAYEDVLAEDIKLEIDTVEWIDRDGRGVELAGGRTVRYDYLIYAVGSASAVADVPGAAEHAYPIGSLEQAERLRPAVRTARSVTVVGAGPTGIETAAELAGQGRAVTLVCGDVLGPYLHPKGRRVVARQLAKLGVTVVQGPGTRVTEVGQDVVRLADGRELPSGVTVWAAGFSVPELAASSGLSTDGTGRLLTDETLTSVDDQRIVAAGDAASPSGRPYRMSCQAAGPLGLHAAGTVLARIAGEQTVPFSLGFVGQCISLGRHTGIVQFAGRGDVAKGYRLSGRTAALIKEYICAYTVKGLTREARKPGVSGWMKGGKAARRRREPTAVPERVG